jgi:DNA ligase (NAD+)
LIADHSKTIENFLDIINKKNINQLLNIDGIGETQIQSIEKFIKNRANINFINKLYKVLSIQKLEINKKGKLKDKTFMFTGKLIDISRAEAKSLVEKNSGSIVSTVNKKLNFLVIGEKPTNKKVEFAKKIGVKILTQLEWSKLLN